MRWSNQVGLSARLRRHSRGASLSTGKTLYQRNHDRLFLPASNMKLFTTALALDAAWAGSQVLPRKCPRTVRRPGACSAAVIRRCRARVFPTTGCAHGPALQAIEDLADQAVTASGMQRIDGDVVGDDRVYPWAPYAPSWTQDDALREFGAPVSALTVNENAIALACIRPGAHAGDPAECRSIRRSNTTRSTIA